MGRQLAEMRMWLIEHIHRTDKDRKVSFDKNPQWKEIYEDPSPDVVLMASAQVGKSLFGGITLFAAAELGLECGWVLPTDPKRNEFVHDKIERTIQNTQYYADRISEARGPDSTRTKHYRGRDGKSTVLHFSTAASDKELVAYSADFMGVDEYDRCDRANLRLVPSRMNQSDYRLTLKVSTPTIPGYQPKDRSQSAPDNIETLFLTGDQGNWYLPCPHCGMWQKPGFYENFVQVEHDDAGRIIDWKVLDQDWSPGSAIDVRMCCANKTCGKPSDRMADGKWRFDNRGAAYRSRWVNRLVADIGEPIADIIDRFSKALGNPTAMQQVHNMDLGISYAGGFVGFKEELFRRCSESDAYTMLSSYEGGLTTAGIDVNVPFYDVQISRWEKNNKQRPQVKLFAGKIQGRDNLYRLLRAFNVKVACMDQQPELNMAVEIQAESIEKIGCKVVRCKYSSHPIAQPYIVSEAGDSVGDPPRLLTLDRTATIDRLYQTMLNREVRWFSNFAEVIGGQMLAEMSRPVRTLITGDRGDERFAWVNGPDHQLHAANLDRVAGEVGGMLLYSYDVPIAAVSDYTHRGSRGPKTGVTPEAQLAAHADKCGIKQSNEPEEGRALIFKA